MKPILFAESATTFNSNGLGRLDCISCTVTEERNGQYELEMVVPEDGLHVDQIAMSSIIVVKPSQNGTLQAFRVYKITKPMKGKFTVLAQHISYQLSYIPVMPFSVLASGTACNQTLQGLKTNSAEANPFTFWTNVTTVAAYNQTIPGSVRQRLGGIEGSVLDQFGGEYEWDNYTVKLWGNRGVQTPTVSLRYGKNITDITQEEYISETITGICPYWQDSEGDTVITLSENVVESEYAENYPYRRTVPIDFSQDFETAPTQIQLRTAAEDYLDKEGIGVPTVSIKISFVNLADTEEYKEIAPLQNVKLCDRVLVNFEKLGISATAKIVKTVYDVLAEKYSSIEIGTVKASLAKTISDTSTAITTTLDKALFATKNATSWLTGSNGYVMAVKAADGTWKELLFLDTDDAETAVNVLRINENGIGFSRNGIAGPYTQAWTLDGKLVVGGTNVPSISVMYNSDEVCHIDKTGIVWNYHSTNKKAIEIAGNSLNFYSWEVDNWPHRVGEIYASSWGSGGKQYKYIDLRGDTSHDDSTHKTGVAMTVDDGNTVKLVLYYNSEKEAANDTPYIINTASGIYDKVTWDGTVVQSGMTIQNGLIKDFSTTSVFTGVIPYTYNGSNYQLVVIGGKIQYTTGPNTPH